MPPYTALVTLIAVALYFYMATRVAAARGRFGVPLPATSVQSGLRTRLSRSSKHPRMDADLSRTAVDLRPFLERSRCCRCWSVLGPRPGVVFRWLYSCCAEPVSGLPHPSHCLRLAFSRRGHRSREAPARQLSKSGHSSSFNCSAKGRRLPASQTRANANQVNESMAGAQPSRR